MIRNAQHIHFIGIGGSGMSGLALIAAEMGKSVSGSDLQRSRAVGLLAGQLSVTISEGHHRRNIPAETDLVIYSPAVPEDNPERRVAAERGIPTLRYGEAVAGLTADQELVAIAGSHGKSTTSALIASILRDAGTDPSFLIGARVAGLHTNAHAGADPRFVLEADEFSRTFLSYSPSVAVLTTVDHEHQDTYPDEDELLDGFTRFSTRIRPGGVLIANADDALSPKVIERMLREPPDGISVVTYGLEAPEAHFQGVVQSRSRTHTVLSCEGTTLTLPMLGQHNASNALAAYVTARHLGVSAPLIATALSRFTGLERRFEHLGTLNNAPAYSDYAHHPSEIRALHDGVTQQYPEHRIHIIFQPHHRGRLKSLFSAFVDTLSVFTNVLILPPYEVPGRDKDETGASGQDLTRAIAERMGSATYFASCDEAVSSLLPQLDSADVVLFVGAGDIDAYARTIVSNHRGT